MRSVSHRAVITPSCLALLFAAPAVLSAQASLPAPMRAAIDTAVTATLKATGAPSASIAVVRGGQIAYANAYGLAELDPARPAEASMRYSIGSISKQFTAAAVLLLQQRGKLSLDDQVSRWLPQLTRANEVTLRQVLSMTSGYQDFWPQDYVMPPMLHPTTAQAIIDDWAKKPLDFDPGSKWQYSNTNYVIAGLIVEKASGMPLVSFLRREVFTPLHMTSVFISDSNALGPTDAQRYLRYALGPLRPAPKEGRGWMFAAGELAMTASDLARWDISVIDQTILKPASYREQQTEVRLTNGVGTGYGLGVDVGMSNGHRLISHNGEVSGFTAQNSIYPDDSVAVVVLVNQDATRDTVNHRVAHCRPALCRDRQRHNTGHRAGAGDLHGVAAWHHRSITVQRQRQRLLLRPGAHRLCLEPRPVGAADRLQPDTGVAAGRDGVPGVPGTLRARHGDGDDVHAS